MLCDGETPRPGRRAGSPARKVSGIVAPGAAFERRSKSPFRRGDEPVTKSFGTCLALSVAGLFVASCDKDHSKVATEKDPAALGPGATPMDVTKAAPKASAGDTVQCV